MNELSEKEKEILEALVNDVPIKAIGCQVHLSTRRVKYILSERRRKWNCKSNYSLIRMATEKGIFAPKNKNNKAA